MLALEECDVSCCNVTDSEVKQLGFIGERKMLNCFWSQPLELVTNFVLFPGVLLFLSVTIFQSPFFSAGYFFLCRTKTYGIIPFCPFKSLNRKRKNDSTLWEVKWAECNGWLALVKCTLASCGETYVQEWHMCCVLLDCVVIMPHTRMEVVFVAHWNILLALCEESEWVCVCTCARARRCNTHTTQGQFCVLNGLGCSYFVNPTIQSPSWHENSSCSRLCRLQIYSSVYCGWILPILRNIWNKFLGLSKAETQKFPTPHPRQKGGTKQVPCCGPTDIMHRRTKLSFWRPRFVHLYIWPNDFMIYQFVLCDERVVRRLIKFCSKNRVKPSGYYMYHQLFSVLPTQCIYVFCVDLRTNSDYFPMQH
jgi:hypothetical protein